MHEGQKRDKRTQKSPKEAWVRASISFPREIYVALEGAAKQKKVSLAWVVRDAAEKYLAERRSIESPR